ncbi:hypothetical protein JCM6882_000421 [Rhodosporidiobolus microsporus]
MDSSPSSQQFEALNHEHRGASTAGEGVDGAGQASPPTSLLDLPDELLASIFDQVWQSLRPKEDDDHVGILVPLEHVLVNKRIFAVARPLWFRHLTTPDDYDDHDSFLSSLLKRRELHPVIQSLHTEHPWHFPVLHSTIIGLLSNLSSLTISFDCAAGDNDASDFIPTCFTDTLKSLDNLRHLRILCFPGVEDDDFKLAHCLPSLRDLDVEGQLAAENLLSDGAPHLEGLTLWTEDVAEVPVPWKTLKRLTLKPREDVVDEPDEVLHALKTALPIQRLVLDFPATRRVGDVTHLFHRPHLYKLLELLQQSHLERLDLTHVDELEWDGTDVQLPSLKVLSLKGNLRVYEKKNLVSLQHFLSMFPSLTTLLIEGFSFSPSTTPQTVDTFAHLPAVSLAAKHPHLFSFLFILRSSAVLEFCLRGVGETREVRWTRSEEAQEFARECWTLDF